jgi:hypothetical protein
MSTDSGQATTTDTDYWGGEAYASYWTVDKLKACAEARGDSLESVARYLTRAAGIEREGRPYYEVISELGAKLRGITLDELPNDQWWLNDDQI